MRTRTLMPADGNRSTVHRPAPRWAVSLAALMLAACAAPALPPTLTASPLPATAVAATQLASPTPPPTRVPTPTQAASSVGLWEDATEATIGTTAEYTNRLELADLNGDGLVDILFANGGNYEEPGQLVMSRVFLNQGPGQMFEEASEAVLGSTGMLARAIKVRDLNGDGHPDILVGTTFQTQSRLYFGDGTGQFTEVTSTHLPKMDASVGDLELGDVDADGDLDAVLADWGLGNPMRNRGGRTMLWLNDGAGRFADATATHMPESLVKFSWELEFVDIDNDYDLDLAVSCKICGGSFLFENNGQGTFSDVTQGRLPQFSNNYDFEAMDLNGDGYLDLVTINDGLQFREHVFINDQRGSFVNATEALWPSPHNLGADDAMNTFLDYDSDGDADFLTGSLDGADRLHINDGAGHLTAASAVFMGSATRGTLDQAMADLNGDGKLDVVQAQGEVPGAEDERVYLGANIHADTAPPVISLVEQSQASIAGQPLEVRARVHDNKSPTMPHDWRAVVLRYTADGQTHETPMTWYGEYLWRAVISAAPSNVKYLVCATDFAGNTACSP